MMTIMRMKATRALLRASGIVLLLTTRILDKTEAAVSCNTSQTCKDLLYAGSECSEGFCTNPFTKRGCLANRLPGWKKIRVCNSEDPPNASSLGYCHDPHPGLEYMEIRLAGQNWESAFFIAWIQQIILSELLDVPTSLESGEANKKINFYDESNALDYGVAYPWDALETATQVKDCRKVNNNDGGNYTPCCQIMSEVWQNRRKNVEELEKKGVIEPYHFLGVFAKAGWYIPRFTGQRDPTLLTYLGLRGEENRRKLAETFLLPTTWLEYCDEVSPDKCTVPNNITARAPADEDEARMYFSQGLYTGHFRAMAQNDCDANPTTCHGHFVDLPCGWSTVFQAQAFHNNIALNTSGDEPFGSGYSYPRLIEIWNAANATKSDVIMHWWQPEALYQLFIGTDAEFQKVDLPPASIECLQSRVDIDSVRCLGDFAAEQGSPEGACDDPDQALMKLFSTGLFESIHDPSIPEARRSPAYDAVNDFTIDALQLDEIFELWLNRSVDRYGFDARNATCEWVANNLEYIQSFVPWSYPRAIQDALQFEALTYTALALGIIAVMLVCLSFVLTYTKRQKTAIRYAQLDFMCLLLVGLLLVSIAAVISAVSNTDAQCISVAWLINVGYTLQLVPLIIKVFAINHLMQAAKHFRRVELKRISLFGAVFLLTFVVVVFMVAWTIIDPPSIYSRYLLTGDTNDAGETILSVMYYCRSGSVVWGFISLAVQGLLLFVASMLAFQMRNLRHELNESQSLATLIYSHFIFWVLRLVLFAWLENSEFGSVVPGIYSLILGLDSIASVCIYFLPKLFFEKDVRRTSSIETTTVTKSTVRFQDENGVAHIDPESDRTQSENSGVAHKGLNKEGSAIVSHSLHGADYIRYEGDCPHCGREIVQELLRSELESSDETVPLNKTERPSQHDESVVEANGAN